MSTGQECDFWLATDGQWYFFLSDMPPEDEDEREYSEWETRGDDYGPFPSFEVADKFLRDNFANPGHYRRDDSGTSPPPENPSNPNLRRPVGWG